MSMDSQYDIFISYKSKSVATANGLYYRLTIKGYSTFFDLDEMKRDNFNVQLLNYIENAKDVFVILEEGSLDACVLKDGTRERKDWKKDWFCHEIAYALEKGKNIIPILLNGYKMPEPDMLPAELKDLSYKHAPEFSYSFFEPYLDKLIKKGYITAKPKSENKLTSVFKFYSNEDCEVFKDGELQGILKGESEEPFYVFVTRKGDYRFRSVNSITAESKTFKEYINADEEKEVVIEWTKDNSFKNNTLTSRQHKWKEMTILNKKDIYNSLEINKRYSKSQKSEMAGEKIIKTPTGIIKYDVFISSKSADYSLAEEVYDFLEKNGLSVFLASKELQRIGESQYGLVIDNILDSSAHMIVVATSLNYIKSKWVQHEWETFSVDLRCDYRNGNLITILDRNIELKQLPSGLRHQTVFYLDDYKSKILNYTSGIMQKTPGETVLMHDSLDLLGSERKKVEPERKEIVEEKRREERAIPTKKNSPLIVNLPKGVKLELVYIKPGSFMMGSPSDELGRKDSEVQHQVTLTQGYWLGKYEVTQAQFEAVMGWNASYCHGADLPVENVSWEDAMNFCARLTADERAAGCLPEGYKYTLPTEAQWEYACRAGTTTALNSGKNLSNKYGCSEMDEVGWDWYNSEINGRRVTHPVGQKQPNAWGLYDMHGNVFEWCLDWYGVCPTSSVKTDPKGPAAGSHRVLRGGSWGHGAGCCRSAYRYYYYPFNSYGDCGFRVALSKVEPERKETVTELSYTWRSKQKAPLFPDKALKNWY